MIDENKLIEEIDNKVCGLTNYQIYKIMDIIQEQPRCNEWILISERLPEEETKVIVSTNDNIVTTGIYTKRYGFSMREGFICDSGFRYLHTNEVLAWQSFPDVYKQEKRDE